MIGAVHLSAGAGVALITFIAVMLVMGGEALLASFNERQLLKRGAVEPEGDVYKTMQWAYPAAFALMAIEGALRGPAPAPVLLSGLVIFGLAKGLKAWAITTLGPRWTFRVLVLQEVPLVVGGPYRLVNHPNYVGVIGELVGVALTVWAPVTGVIAVVGFGLLIRARIRVEDRALGRS